MADIAKYHLANSKRLQRECNRRIHQLLLSIYMQATIIYIRSKRERRRRRRPIYRMIYDSYRYKISLSSLSLSFAFIRQMEMTIMIVLSFCFIPPPSTLINYLKNVIDRPIAHTSQNVSDPYNSTPYFIFFFKMMKKPVWYSTLSLLWAFKRKTN